MTASIVYSSKTGNTALLAERIRNTLGETVVSCGAPSAAGGEAERVFVGFWTDKGSCPEEIADFLRTLRGKQVFLFGTAGFGSDPEYFDQILARVKEHLDGSNTVIGTYMCQGRMPAPVRKRYEAMEASDPERARFLLDNFDRALEHPNEADLEALARAVAE